MIPPDLRAAEPGFTEPGFVEPWEARVFALVVTLAEQGRFPWASFQALLTEEIARGPRPYYESWLAAAERLFDGLGVLRPAELDAAVAALRPDDRTVRWRGDGPPDDRPA